MLTGGNTREGKGAVMSTLIRFVMGVTIALGLSACEPAQHSKDPKIREQQQQLNNLARSAEVAADQVMNDASRLYDDMARSATRTKVELEAELEEAQRKAGKLLAEGKQLDEIRQAAVEGTGKVMQAAQAAIEYVKPSAQPTPRGTR